MVRMFINSTTELGHGSFKKSEAVEGKINGDDKDDT